MTIMCEKNQYYIEEVELEGLHYFYYVLLKYLTSLHLYATSQGIFQTLASFISSHFRKLGIHVL